MGRKEEQWPSGERRNFRKSISVRNCKVIHGNIDIYIYINIYMYKYIYIYVYIYITLNGYGREKGRKKKLSFKKKNEIEMFRKESAPRAVNARVIRALLSTYYIYLCIK